MDVFVYGTLTRPERVAAIVDSFVFLGDAVLDGLHPVEGQYPTLAPGGETPGRLLRVEDVAALDAYEGVDEGTYVRVSVPRATGEPADGERELDDGTDERERDDGSVEVYVGDPAALGADATWPGTGSFEARVRQYVAAADVQVRRGDGP